MRSIKTLELIQRGGFGRVEKVRDLTSGAIFARKVFDPYHPDSAEETAKLKRRFRREVEVQRAIKSPALMPIVDFELDVDEPWFLMPLADRNFLEEIQRNRSAGTIPEKGLADILNGLEELHSLGFVHRDLKPQNILLYEAVWRLSDFGLVLPPSGTTTRLTSTDSNYGTADYGAPEQSTQFHTVSPSVDIYSFGCILHDIFSGVRRVPYLRQTADGAIGAVIEKCTETKPEKRFKSAKALRLALTTTLSEAASQKPKDPPPWARELRNFSDWSAGKQIDLARQLAKGALEDSLEAIFESLDEEKLRKMHQLDADSWKEIALVYCDWIENGEYPYSYCDLLAIMLQNVFELGDIELKAAAAVSTARLGYKHNRWYVMRSLHAMCGHSVDDTIARRIAIEIAAAELQSEFQTCAEAVGVDATVYHPIIAAAVASIET